MEKDFYLESVIADGAAASSYAIRPVQVYKGVFKFDKMNLPSSVKLGEEYIVFVKEREGALALATRLDSLYSSGSEDWSDIQALLEK